MFKLTTFVLAACAISAQVHAATTTKITGVYSDLHYIEESGDLLGTEVFIVFGGSSGYYAYLQCAEGGPSKPVVVAATVHGNEVELAPHNEPNTHCPNSKFKGKVSRQGLEGKFEGTDYPGLLKRKRSYWQ